MTKLLDATLPEDIHERGRGRLHVGVTYLNTPGKLYKPELLSDFDSKQDVLDALLVSCHVPLWFDSRLITRHRGVWAFDGGFSDTGFIPMPPQADYVRGVRVCCFPNARVLFPDIDMPPTCSLLTSSVCPGRRGTRSTLQRSRCARPCSLKESGTARRGRRGSAWTRRAAARWRWREKILD